MRTAYMRDNLKAGKIIKTREKSNFHHTTMFDFIPYIHDFINHFCILERPYIASLFPDKEKEPTKDQLPNIYILYNIMKLTFSIRPPNSRDWSPCCPRFCASTLDFYRKRILRCDTRLYEALKEHMYLNDYQLSRSDFEGMISNIFYLLKTQI